MEPNPYESPKGPEPLSPAKVAKRALAAIAAAEHVGVAPEIAATALAGFENVKRRMEVRGTVTRAGGRITVYDDFAHHPTAIRTTVDGLKRRLKPDERIRSLIGWRRLPERK